jgi:hypothetical protein
MTEDGVKEVGLPLAGRRALTADQQAELRGRLHAEAGRLRLGWASLWVACSLLAVAVLIGHMFRKPGDQPLAGAITGLGLGTVLASMVGLLAEVVNGQGAARWLFALLLPLPLVVAEGFVGLVSKDVSAALLVASLFTAFAGLALLVLRVPDRHALGRLFRVAEADIARGEVLVFRGRPDCRFAHRLALRCAGSNLSQTDEQTLEFLPESRLLVRVNDRLVARPHTIRGKGAPLVRLATELEGMASGHVHLDKLIARRFWCEVALCAFVCTWWGVGCGDIFHPAGDGPALGAWGPIVFVGLGIATVVVFAVRHRKDRSDARGAIFALTAVLGIVGGWYARDRVAAEVWNLRCSPDWKGMRYCRDAAQKLGFFTTKIGNTDILGRTCIGSEWPYVMCRYFPLFAPPNCKRVASECAEIGRKALRSYACVERICEEWEWRCKYGPEDDAPPALRTKLRQMYMAP